MAEADADAERVGATAALRSESGTPCWANGPPAKARPRMPYRGGQPRPGAHHVDANGAHCPDGKPESVEGRRYDRKVRARVAHCQVPIPRALASCAYRRREGEAAHGQRFGGHLGTQAQRRDLVLVEQPLRRLRLPYLRPRVALPLGQGRVVIELRELQRPWARLLAGSRSVSCGRRRTCKECNCKLSRWLSSRDWGSSAGHAPPAGQGGAQAV